MNLEAFLFVPALAGSVVCGLLFACFAAHHYLTILESTAAGGREVTWLPETFLEFCWKAGYIAWLLSLCYAPAYILSRLLTSEACWRLVLLAVLLGVAYPISQLSSLSASSPWYPLQVGTLQRLMRRPLLPLGFYLSSLPILGLLALSLYGAFWGSVMLPLRLACAFVAVLSLFLYARLLGRLAYVLQLVEPLIRRRRRRRKKRTVVDLPAAATAAVRNAPAPPRLVDLPPLQTPLDGTISGYELQVDEPTPTARRQTSTEAIEAPDESPPIPRQGRPLRRARLPDPEDDVPYLVQAAEVEPGRLAPPELLRPTDEERRFHLRQQLSEADRRLWNADFLVFLMQPRTLSAWSISSGLACVLVLLVQLARAFYPGAGD